MKLKKKKATNRNISIKINTIWELKSGHSLLSK